MQFDLEFKDYFNKLNLDQYFVDYLRNAYQQFSFHIMMAITHFTYRPEDYYVFMDLGLLSKEYAIQKFFQPRVDTYIRDYLINGVIENVLEDREFCVYRPSMPDKYMGDDKYYSTLEYEKGLSDFSGIELVIVDMTKKTGYMYTFPADQSKYAHFLDMGMLDEVVFVNWGSLSGVTEPHDKEQLLGKYKNKVRTISYRDFLQEIFTSNEAKAFDYYLHRVIEEYQEAIGISSIPKLTAPILFEHRLEIECGIKNSLEMDPISEISKNVPPLFSLSKGYIVIEEKNRNNYSYQNIDEKSVRLILQHPRLQKIIDKKLYKALTGRGDFAKSFLTSEYLYNLFGKSDQFDYTSIVSGYLKSVEQLMYCLVLFKKDKRDAQGRFYRVGPQNHKTTITSSHILADKIDATMGNLIHFFIDDYPDTILIESEEEKEVFNNCLKLYLDECRNQSFHKHNNYEWSRVENIRHNTFIIYLLLLSCCSLGEDDEETTNHLKIVTDDRLERIYYWLRKKQMYTFRIRQKGEKDLLEVTREAEESFPIFDSYGLLQDFHIYLNTSASSQGSIKTKRKIVISRDSIPDEIWYTTFIDSYPIDYSI